MKKYKILPMNIYFVIADDTGIIQKHRRGKHYNTYFNAWRRCKQLREMAGESYSVKRFQQSDELPYPPNDYWKPKQSEEDKKWMDDWVAFMTDDEIKEWREKNNA